MVSTETGLGRDKIKCYDALTEISFQQNKKMHVSLLRLPCEKTGTRIKKWIEEDVEQNKI